MYEQALDATKLPYSHLRHAKAVAKRFELCRRRHNLSWSHHQEVAHIDDLAEAEQNGWSQKSLQNGGDGSYFGRMPPQVVENLLSGSRGRPTSRLTRLPAVGTTDDDTAKKEAKS